MKVYHGTTTWKMHSIYSGDFSRRFPGLFVTDTYERAAMYANSQVGREVTTETELLSCAVVMEIEVDHDVRWLRRPESHHTLDKCETVISHGKIVKAFVGKPGKTSYTALEDLKALHTLGIDVTEFEALSWVEKKLAQGKSIYG